MYTNNLAERYKPYFKIGTAVNTKTIVSHRDLIVNHFNSVTCENEMKFASIHPTANEYSFKEADQIVHFAKQHHLNMRGHTLIWHNQTPNWIFENKSMIFDSMKEHIQTIMTRYHDVVYAWDVVNEAVADDGPHLYRQSKWLELCGEAYIEKAFQYAAEVNQQALLVYNDYNTTHPQKRDKIYTLIKSLKEKGTPIHGIGMQGHWNIFSPTISEIREAIEKYASLSVKIQITELDLSVYKWDDLRSGLTTPETAMLELQAKRYEEIFQLFREYKDVIESVTLWGVADDCTWLTNFPVKGRKNWPLLFDEYHFPKDSFRKIIDF